jgi:hypothetical protein
MSIEVSAEMIRLLGILAAGAVLSLTLAAWWNARAEQLAAFGLPLSTLAAMLSPGLSRGIYVADIYPGVPH